MATSYKPYSDIKNIYDLKGQWDDANKKGDINAANRIATTAQIYYNNLKKNHRGDIAQALSVSGYSEAKPILDAYTPQVSNMSTAEQANHNTSEVNQKVNTLWGLQTDDHGNMTEMYKKEYDDIKNTNPFTTDEAKAILAKYDLAGLQGRDNAVASGSASNGGNIDSYAAANAMRQQAALTNQGQMAVLDAHQQKIDNARSILEGLGAYQKDSYTGMQNTIGIQQTEAQRLFENDQTAKNNDVARKKEIASVTGYSPDEWIVSNNPYMNEDGTIKDKYKNIDFSAVMAKAKASGNTATYNAAATARFYKIMSDYGKYGQYDDGNYIVPGTELSEPSKQFRINNDTVLESFKTEKDIADNANTTALAQTNAQIQANERAAQEQAMSESEFTTQMNAINKFTDAQIKKVDKVVEEINKTFKKHKSNPNQINLISPVVDGKYSFNPNTGSYSNNVKSWRWHIKSIVEPMGLTTAEKALFYKQIGLTEDDIIEMYGG